MSYIPNPVDVTAPLDTEKGSTAAAEFRALKLYIRDVVIPGLSAGKLNAASPSWTGSMVGTGNVTLKGAANALIGNSADNLTNLGTLSFDSTASRVYLEAAASMVAVELRRAGQAVGFNGIDFSCTSARDLGKVTQRWGMGYFSQLNITASVQAGSFIGDGSQLTNLPNSGGSLVTSAIIVGALGYTPYSAANPAGYVSSVSTGMVIGAIGYTPYNASNPNGYISGISKATVDTAVGFTTGTNGRGTRTVSTSAPSGGSDGDIWYQVAP